MRLNFNRARQFLAGALESTGLIRFVNRLMGGRDVILTFHRVRRDSEALNPFDTCPSITTSFLRECLLYVRGAYRVLPLEEFAQGKGRNGRPLLTITFDDGWRDNYELGLEILRELRIPATIFVTAGKVGSREPFWQQRLGSYFSVIQGHAGTPLEEDFRALVRVAPTAPLGRDCFAQTVARWKRRPLSEIEVLLNALGEMIPLPPNGARLFLDEREVRELSRDGVAIGSHSMTHRILTRESLDVVDWELRQSKALLEGLIGSRVRLFSYPNGEATPQIEAKAAEIGYEITCAADRVKHGRSGEARNLPRIDVGSGRLRNAAGEFSPGLLLIEVARSDTIARAHRFGGRLAAMPARPPAKQGVKVLFLLDMWFGADGGTEQHLLYLLRRLPAAGVQAHVAVLYGGDYLGQLAPFSPLFLHARGGTSVFGLIRPVLRLADYAERHAIDIIHTIFPTSETASLMLNLIDRARPIVAARRNAGHLHTPFSLLRTRLQNHLIQTFLFNSRNVQESLGRLEGIPGGKTAVIYNPVPRARINEGLARPWRKEELGLGADVPVVGMVGSVRPVKDYETLVRAARFVLDRVPKTTFLAIGREEGTEGQRLRALAAKLGVAGNIRWVGSIDNPVAILPLVDVGVLCSRAEGLSNTLIEYGAAGIPAVATNVGGNSEVVIEGETGFLVPPASPERLAERLVQLLLNPDLRRELGERAKVRTALTFDEDRVLESYTSFYRSLLTGPGTSNSHST
jgi:glycosyltransferase involved in cell wall biosynthesis/peptidoglycan/xylan/chitin deacetylase (PgdA/CDA1 family)